MSKANVNTASLVDALRTQIADMHDSRKLINELVDELRTRDDDRGHVGVCVDFRSGMYSLGVDLDFMDAYCVKFLASKTVSNEKVG